LRQGSADGPRGSDQAPEERTDLPDGLLRGLLLDEVPGLGELDEPRVPERRPPALERVAAECRVLHPPQDERGLPREPVPLRPEILVPLARGDQRPGQHPRSSTRRRGREGVDVVTVDVLRQLPLVAERGPEQDARRNVETLVEETADRPA